MKITTNFIKQTKRHLSASGSILLPLALKWRLVAFMASVILAVLVTPCLAPHMAAAASITLTVPNDPLSLTLTPTPEGTFSSTAANVLIKTDALAGYTLSIKAKDGTDLKNKSSTDPKNVITSISSATTVSKNDFRDKADYNNKWGFAFGKGGEGNTFHGLNGTNAVTVGSSTEPNSSNDTYSITLGARVNNELAVGAYSNTFIIEASANAVNYNVKYDGNSTASDVSNLPSSGALTSASTKTQSFKISSQEPTRTGGYEFIGWCDQKPTKESNANGTYGVDICPTGAYQASDEYDLTAKDQTVTLYAMWVDNSHIMQNWKGCATANLNEQITLVDTRDNREYYVARLADGNCWMTENLDLFIDKNTTYTVDDTDLDHASEDEIAACTARGEDCTDKDGKYQWKPTESTHTTGDTGWDGKHGVGLPSQTQPQSYDPGDVCWKGEQIWSSDNHTADIKSCNSHDSSHYHFGNYYTYSAAVAQNDTGDYTQDGDYYHTSICPVGWQLPNRDGNEKTFANLNKKSGNTWVADYGYINIPTQEQQEKQSGDTVHREPFFFTYTGYWAGEYRSIGVFSHYLSNAIHGGSSDSWACVLRFTGAGSVNYCHGLNREHAGSVRCVLRQ